MKKVLNFFRRPSRKIRLILYPQKTLTQRRGDVEGRKEGDKVFFSEDLTQRREIRLTHFPQKTLTQRRGDAEKRKDGG